MSLLRRKAGPYELVYMSLRGHTFPPHTHDRYLISMSLRGLEQLASGGAVFQLASDDISLLNVGQVEASTSVTSPWTFVSLYLDASVADAAGWRFGRRHVHSPIIARSLRDLARTAFAGQSSCVFERSAESILNATLDSAGSTVDGTSQARDHKIFDAQQVLLDTEGHTPSLAAISAAIDLSVPELVRRFKRENGLPPFAWSYDRRLQRALLLVDQGVPLARIAAELGYSDQAHMTRRFKAAVGVSPGIWAQSKISFNTES